MARNAVIVRLLYHAVIVAPVSVLDVPIVAQFGVRRVWRKIVNLTVWAVLRASAAIIRLCAEPTGFYSTCSAAAVIIFDVVVVTSLRVCFCPIAARIGDAHAFLADHVRADPFVFDLAELRALDQHLASFPYTVAIFEVAIVAAFGLNVISVAAN